MNELLKKALAVPLAVVFAVPALAQDEPAAGASEMQEIRRYTVEIVIFSYTEDFGRGSEQFYPDAPAGNEFDGSDAEELGLIEEVEVPPARPGVALDIYAANMESLAYVPLAEDEYTLTNVVDRFELLDAYETIMHFGWTQPTLPPDYARPVSLHTFGAPPMGLDGTFELYLSRYLHLVVDLTLAATDEAATTSGPRNAPGLRESRPSYEDVVAEFGATGPVLYRIQEDRIFKNGDIRYFDHPKFGVVAKVTRVEEEPAEPAGPDPLLSRTGQ